MLQVQMHSSALKAITYLILIHNSFWGYMFYVHMHSFTAKTIKNLYQGTDFD